MMKDEEKRETIAWEAKDPKPPVIHSAVPGSRGECHRRAEMMRCYDCRRGREGACPWLGRGGICLAPEREPKKPQHTKRDEVHAKSPVAGIS